MTSPSMPKIFRSMKRYSDRDRPMVGAQCFFSHCSCLIQGEFVETSEHRSWMYEWIKQNAIVSVVRNALTFVEVRFADAPQTDYVSPEFLMSMELTAFGQAFVDQNAEKMSPGIRKYFVGVEA